MPARPAVAYAAPFIGAILGVALVAVSWFGWSHLLHRPALSPETAARLWTNEMLYGQGGHLYDNLNPWEHQVDGFDRAKFKKLAAWISASYKGYVVTGDTELVHIPDGVLLTTTLASRKSVSTTFELAVIKTPVATTLILSPTILSALRARGAGPYGSTPQPLRAELELRDGLHSQVAVLRTLCPKGISDSAGATPALRTWDQWLKSNQWAIANLRGSKGSTTTGTTQK